MSNIDNNLSTQSFKSKHSVSRVKPLTNGSTNAPTILDTLAQLDHNKPNPLENKVLAKYLSRAIIFPLIDLNSPLKKSYWRTFHCSNTLIQEGQKLRSSYCKNRWCIVCNRIRTATLMNGYLEQIKEFKSGTFLTLTRPNVGGAELMSEIESLTKLFSLIQRKAKRIGLDNTSLRKLECTYNAKHKNYNPHLHVICSNIELATFIRKEWLKRNLNAYKGAQDLQPCTDNTAQELFKYFTKLLTITNERDSKGVRQMELNPYPLDIILQSIRGKRTFQTYGNIRLVSEDLEQIESQDYPSLSDEENLWQYNPIVHNYVSLDAEILVDIEPTQVYGLIVKQQ